RHFVREARPGTRSEAAAHVLGDRALGTIKGRLGKVPLWKALAQDTWIAHGLLRVVRARHISEGLALADVSGSAKCYCALGRGRGQGQGGGRVARSRGGRIEGRRLVGGAGRARVVRRTRRQVGTVGRVGGGGIGIVVVGVGVVGGGVGVVSVGAIVAVVVVV